MSEGTVKSKGTVKWYSEPKGFGFIAPDDGSADVFVHTSVVIEGGYRALVGGQRVTFVAIQNPGGPYAQQVTVIL